MAYPTSVPTPAQRKNFSISTQGAVNVPSGAIGPSSPGYVQGTANRVIDPNALYLSGGNLSFNPNYNANPNQSVGINATQGATLGTSTGGGGGDSQLDMFRKMMESGGLNPSQQSEYQNLLSAQNNSAEAQRAAALSQANTEFDRNKAALELQLGGLGTQKDNAFAEIDTGLEGVISQVEKSRNNAQTNTDQQVQQAGSIAQSTQDQNRRVLRALGIINSTAAGELLTKPMNEFDKQRGQLQVALGQRLGELDDFMNQKASEAQNAKNDILSQYTQAYNAIQNDLRFNDRQRLDAVQAINAQAQQHLADIQNQLFNYQNQINIQKQNFAMGLAQMAAYQNPTIGSDYLQNFLLTNQGQGNQTAAIFNPTIQDKDKNNLLSTQV